MTRRKRTATIAAVAAVALAAALGWLLLRSGGGGAALIVAHGTVEATDADLGFEVAGRVGEIAVREGDRVQPGQVLAVLDRRQLEASRAAAAARLGETEARLEELRAGFRSEEVGQASAAVRAAGERRDEARRELDRARRLFEGGAVSLQELERRQTALDVADAELERARENLRLFERGPRVEQVRAAEAASEGAAADLARADARLRDAEIRAPFAGLVTVRHREPGESVTPGAPILTLLDPDDRWVRIYVRQDRVGRIDIGQTARIRSDAWEDRRYEGRVTFIADEAEFTPRNVQTTEERVKLVYEVKVRITGDAGFELKPGLAADVELETPR